MMNLRVYGAAIALALGVAAVSPVQAVTFQKNVILTNSSPTYNAVGSPNAMPYEAIFFTVSTGGSYSFTLSTSGGYLPNLGLYSPSFLASAPSTNILNSAQHGSFTFGVGFTTTLTAGTSYVAVAAGDLFAAAGGSNPPQYVGQLQISGPGTVALGAAPAVVPEPASWALLAVGFGMVGGAIRARRKAGLALA